MAITRIDHLQVNRLDVQETTVAGGTTFVDLANAATDEKAKVSSNDTTPGFLNGKLVAGTNVTLTENNNGGNETLTISASGGGLSGTDYVYVAANGTNTQNGTALLAAYTTAKTMSPSATRRIRIICAPGRYDLVNSVLTFDTEYIDIVSLDGNRSVYITSSGYQEQLIVVNTNNVFIKGITTDRSFLITFDNGNNIVIHNCYCSGIRGFGYFSNQHVLSGTFQDLETGPSTTGFACASTGTLSGTWINCTSASSTHACFGNNSSSAYTLSGLFKNCYATGDGSFGGMGATASGTFENCTMGRYGLGNIMGGVTGTFIGCLAIGKGLGSDGSNFNRIKSTARIYYCRLSGAGVLFGTVEPGGRVYYSVDGDGNVNNQ